MTNADLTEIKARAERAHDEVVRMCRPGERWRMSIPADESRDSDLVLVATINDTRTLVAEVESRRMDSLADIATKIRALSEWIDGSYPTDVLAVEELHVRRRVDKLGEEFGEVITALGGMYGENPRKGVTHTLDDLLKELLDVAAAALGAYESMTSNRGTSIEALAAHVGRVAARAGLSAGTRNPPALVACTVDESASPEGDEA